MQPELNLIEFLKLACEQSAVQTYLNENHHLGLASPKLSATEIIAIAKMVCAGAAVACPIIDSLP
jgi:hypothetical protein